MRVVPQNEPDVKMPRRWWWCGAVKQKPLLLLFSATGAVVTDALEKKAGDRWRRMAEPKISRRLTCTCASTSIKSRTHECNTSARRSYEFDNNKNHEEFRVHSSKYSGSTSRATVSYKYSTRTVQYSTSTGTNSCEAVLHRRDKEKKKKTDARPGLIMIGATVKIHVGY